MKRSLGRVKSEHFLKKEVARSKKEVDNLVYNEKSFTENNEKVVFCTGLSTWELFHVLFQYIKPKLKQYSVLTPFQQLMITTMRLDLVSVIRTLPIVLRLVVPPLVEPLHM